jgi:YVTN family beta-propeller protein
MRKLVLLLALFVVAGCSSIEKRSATHSQSETNATELDVPGPRGSGTVRLPNQWWLKPVGRQIVLGDFPVNIALHPSGDYAAVLHCGHGQHEIIVLTIPEGKIVSRANLDESFYGITFSENGSKIFCSGAGDECVYVFNFNKGYLSEPAVVQLREKRLRAMPGGIAASSDGKRLFVANVLGHRVTEVELDTQSVRREVRLGTNDLVAVDPQAEVTEDEAAIRKRAEAVFDPGNSEDPYPYACVLDERQQRLYVSLWAQSSVAVIDLKTGDVLHRWKTEEHPNEMVLSKSGKHLFVANANRNTVSVIDTANGRVVETLLAELQPNSPPGNTPNSLALSRDEKLLFVANANINTVAVFDISEFGRSRSLGFIPVGWYPTSVRVSANGKHLFVANGKGIISKANRHGPQPGNDPPATVREYIGGLLRGTFSIIDLPVGEELERRMKRYTVQAFSCMPNADKPVARNEENPIPAEVGGKSPIKYCIYIVKENRTYDQVLGDMPEGNGDLSLCLFPEKITPNHHKLAREFVLLDNFYVESEVSADGHEWTMGAYATDFVEKSWPLSYGHNKHKKYTYPAEGNFPIAMPSEGYLWDRARQAGVSYRSYGEFVQNRKGTNEPCFTRVASLKGHFDPWFRSFDMDYPDVLRAERFISELKRFEKEGEMPRLQIVRLPNDHTSGTAAGKWTPVTCVKDNDLAFGMVVEAVSKSKFWPQTAIFVVEDDAQNGPDHVDAHRTVAYVISPYTKRKFVDSTMYSTASMLRTMELILGLKPMSQFDATATPMYNSFQGQPNLRPYEAEPVRVDFDERNLKTAWGSKLSDTMDLTKEDAADDLLLNEVIWRSIRGADSPMPSPVRAAFVFPQAEEDED